jgi:DNA transformation protein and related proteins
LEAFSYNKSGKEMKISYFQAPEEALENLDVMNVWANKAYGAVLRATVKKKK